VENDRRSLNEFKLYNQLVEGMKAMRMLVISSVNAYMHPSPLSPEYAKALRNAGLPMPSSDIDDEFKYLKAVKLFSKRAKDLFKGSFRNVLKGVRAARGLGICVDLFLISPRYGVISEDEYILPYSFSLTRKPRSHIRKASGTLKTKEKINSIFKTPYDLCVVIANKNDLLLIHDPPNGSDLASLCKRIVVFSAPSAATYFKGNAQFFGVRQVGGRTDSFLKFLDELTSKPLSDYAP